MLPVGCGNWSYRFNAGYRQAIAPQAGLLRLVEFCSGNTAYFEQ